MMRVGLVILLILAMVSSLHICEFVVINKLCLLTSVSDTDRGGTTFSTVAPVKEILYHPGTGLAGLATDLAVSGRPRDSIVDTTSLHYDMGNSAAAGRAVHGSVSAGWRSRHTLGYGRR